MSSGRPCMCVGALGGCTSCDYLVKSIDDYLFVLDDVCYTAHMIYIYIYRGTTAGGRLNGKNTDCHE